MREVIISLPFANGAPVFPDALVDANPSNPVSDGTPGDGWQTICYTPTEGKCLVRVWTDIDAIADTLLAETDLPDLLNLETLDGAALTALETELTTVYADDVVALVLDDSTTPEDILAKLLDVERTTKWSPGLSVQVDEVYYYERNLYRVVQAHTTQAVWTPDVTAALFTRHYNTGPVNPDPWVQPTGAHDAYQIGDRVTHNGTTWESTVANNVWEPGVFGWTQV